MFPLYQVPPEVWFVLAGLGAIVAFLAVIAVKQRRSKKELAHKLAMAQQQKAIAATDLQTLYRLLNKAESEMGTDELHGQLAYYSNDELVLENPNLSRRFERALTKCSHDVLHTKVLPHAQAAHEAYILNTSRESLLELLRALRNIGSRTVQERICAELKFPYPAMLRTLKELAQEEFDKLLALDTPSSFAEAWESVNNTSLQSFEVVLTLPPEWDTLVARHLDSPNNEHFAKKASTDGTTDQVLLRLATVLMQPDPVEVKRWWAACKADSALWSAITPLQGMLTTAVAAINLKNAAFEEPTH